MTLPLRRKHRTISRLVLTLASLAGLASSSAAAEQEISNAQRVSDEVRQMSDSLLNVNLLQRDPPRDDVIKVDTSPPSRDRLFRLRSEEKVLGSIENDFKQKNPNQNFLLPLSADKFSRPDNPVLGSNWFQNRKTGSSADKLGELKGEMQVKNRQGVYPAGARPEVAILGENVGSNDVFVAVEIELGVPNAAFGLVMRASDPNLPLEQVDQIEWNKFYYVVATSDAIAIGKRVSGKSTPLDRKSVSAKSKFQLSVRCYGKQMTVFRDTEEVLTIEDDELKGEYVGLIGLEAPGAGTKFDNFAALRYGGKFDPRNFAAVNYQYKGANVHYRPLYFEQAALERYGHHAGNLFQPLISHGLFFADVLMLPYSVANSPPWVCHSNECFEKPGDPVLPFRLHPPDVCSKGAGWETAVIAAMLIGLP